MYIRRSVKHIDIDGKETVYRSIAAATAATGVTPPTIEKYALKRLYLQDGSRFEFVPLRTKPRHHLSISFSDPAEALAIEKLSRKLKTSISDTARVLIKIGLQNMPEEWANNVAAKAPAPRLDIPAAVKAGGAPGDVPTFVPTPLSEEAPQVSDALPVDES